MLLPEGRKGPGRTKHITYVTLEGENVMQSPITFLHFRYLQQQTSFLLQPWKSEDKNTTPESIFNLSPNDFFEVENTCHPS